MVRFRRYDAQRPILSSILAMSMVCATPALAAAGSGADFVVAGDDSYGVADCMKPGMECGRIIADAWCEAHGHGHASAFGLADDVTGSTKVSTAAVIPPTAAAPAVVIRCGE